MSLRKRLSFKRVWNFSAVSKTQRGAEGGRTFSLSSGRTHLLVVFWEDAPPRCLLVRAKRETSHHRIICIDQHPLLTHKFNKGWS